jgi:hypothetical protein
MQYNQQQEIGCLNSIYCWRNSLASSIAVDAQFIYHQCRSAHESAQTKTSKQLQSRKIVFKVVLFSSAFLIALAPSSPIAASTRYCHNHTTSKNLINSVLRRSIDVNVVLLSNASAIAFAASSPMLVSNITKH